MFTKKTLPSPPPLDPADWAEAERANRAAHEGYIESMQRATAAIQQGDRMRRIRIVNNIGPSFGVVYERRRGA